MTVIATATPIPTPSTLPAVQHAPEKAGYRIVFDDEFTGSALDRNLWTPTLPWGNTNRDEAQYYTPDALSQRGGVLAITARRQPIGGKPYDSGAITSDPHFRFAYGYTEMRAQVPAGDGLWSAFWLVVRSAGSNEEADIMEVLGSDPAEGNSVLHYGTVTHKQRSLHAYRGPDFSAGYHTFGLDWQPGTMVWYVDGVERYRVTKGVPSAPMVIIANLTVGGAGSWSGPPDSRTAFPAQYKIDYIRVYQRK